VRERLAVVWRNRPKRVALRLLASDRLFIAVRCVDYAGAVAWADTLIRNRWRTPAWFRVHPDFAPLRGRPDFERLVAGR
jgi:hypothetical protein